MSPENVFSLPGLSVVALFMSTRSRKWQNGGVRATMYLVEIYACLALAVSLQGTSAAAVDIVNVIEVFGQQSPDQQLTIIPASARVQGCPKPDKLPAKFL